MNPAAIGYLRADVSGTSQVWHETQIRSLAKRFGYDLGRIVVFNARTDDPLRRLLIVVGKTKAEAVFVPSEEHFGGPVPKSLIDVCDVVAVDSEHTHSRQLANVFDPPKA